MKMSLETSNETEKPGAVECTICKDTEVVFGHQEEGSTTSTTIKYEMYKPCSCVERKAWRRRFKNAYIPDEFEKSTLENYMQESEVQKNMLSLARNYLQAFPESKEELIKKGMINFGFIAIVGEQRIRSLPEAHRTETKNKHNSFGLGKTHLHVALSKRLLKNGFHVLMISDVDFMDEMMNAKRMNDEGETFNKLLKGVMQADVLVWDDIGKSKHSEAKESLYYNIINERYKKQKPIVFSSNEDRGTLSERIGYAATSRLLSRCGENLLETEGEDWRFKKND